MLVAVRNTWPEGGVSSLLGTLHFAEKGFHHLDGAVATIGGIALVAAVCWLIVRAARSGETAV